VNYLGIDWGEKRIGLAFARMNVASPLETLVITAGEDGVSRVVRACKDLEIERIIIGIPLDREGRETPQAKNIRDFGRKLSAATGLAILYWNEALSSKEALSRKIAAGSGKKSRRNLDATAAAVILQDYLDSEYRAEKKDPTGVSTAGS